MHRFILTLAALITLACSINAGSCFHIPSACAQDKAVLPPSRGDIAGTIRLLLKDMEAPEPDYGKILLEYGLPEGNEDVKQHGEFDRHVKRFATEIAPLMLKALHYVKDKSPVFESDGTQATYDLTPLNDSLPADKKLPTRKMSFKLIQGKWYLK
ncbi:MAG: hypothetical protein ACAI35_25540 [Candidatus Methylacidiphilales bacterium]|nr:hypothetical protein [Candidatus Methylacidiphilales bacterium]